MEDRVLPLLKGLPQQLSQEIFDTEDLNGWIKSLHTTSKMA